MSGRSAKARRACSEPGGRGSATRVGDPPPEATGQHRSELVHCRSAIAWVARRRRVPTWSSTARTASANGPPPGTTSTGRARRDLARLAHAAARLPPSRRRPPPTLTTSGAGRSVCGQVTTQASSGTTWMRNAAISDVSHPTPVKKALAPGRPGRVGPHTKFRVGRANHGRAPTARPRRPPLRPVRERRAGTGTDRQPAPLGRGTREEGADADGHDRVTAGTRRRPPARRRSTRPAPPRPPPRSPRGRRRRAARGRRTRRAPGASAPRQVTCRARPGTLHVHCSGVSRPRSRWASARSRTAPRSPGTAPRRSAPRGTIAAMLVRSAPV